MAGCEFCLKCGRGCDCPDFSECEAWRSWFAGRWGETRALFGVGESAGGESSFGQSGTAGDTLGERLIELKNRDGRDWRVLAELCGVSRISMFRYVSGRRLPSEETLFRMAEIFDVPVDYLTDVSGR